MISSASQEKLKTNYPLQQQQGIITAKIVSLPADPQSNSVTSGMFGGNKLSKMLSEKSSPKAIKIRQNLDTRQRSSNRLLEKSSAVYLRGSYERNGQVVGKDSSLDSFQTDRRLTKKQFEAMQQLRKAESSKKLLTEEVAVNSDFSNLETSIRWVVSPCKSRSKDRLHGSYKEQSQTIISLSSLPQQPTISQIPRDNTKLSGSNTLPSFNLAKLNTTNFNQNRYPSSQPAFAEDEIQLGYAYNQPIIKKKKIVLQPNSFYTQQQQQFQKLQKIQQSYQQYPSKMTPFHTPIPLHSNSNITLQTPLKPFQQSTSNSYCNSLPLHMQSQSQSPANTSFQIIPVNSSQQIASINNLESPDKLGIRIPSLKYDKSQDALHSVTLSSFQMKLGIERSDTDRGAHRQPSIHFETTRHSNEGRYKNKQKSNNYFVNNSPATCNNFTQKKDENLQLLHANSVRNSHSVKVSVPSGNLYKQYMNSLAGVEVRSWQRRLEEQQRQQPSSKHCLLSQVFEKEGVNLSDLNQSQGQKKQTKNQNANSQTLLRFPASQKELQEFSQALDQNELRFARTKDQHEWLNQEKLGNSSSSSNLLRPLESKEPASMKIEARVRERNQQIEQQDIEQRKFTFDLKMRQTVQLDNLIKEQINLQQQSMRTTGRRSPFKYKKDNYQLQQQQLLETSFLRQTSNENDISPRGQLAPSKEEAERELAKETHLVDFLQQKKRKVRDVLERFLESRPRFVKAISRSCLMDIEQFVFFVMSFFQYCIDDMFARFKTSNTLRLAAIASKDAVGATNMPGNFPSNKNIPKNENADIQLKNNNNNINHHRANQFTFMGQTIDKFNIIQSQPQQNTSAVGVSSQEFSFSQKIPEEIMKIVLEVIKHALAGTENQLHIEETLQGLAQTTVQQGDKQISQGIGSSNTNTKSSLKKKKFQKEKTKYDSNSIYNNMQPITLTDTLDIATGSRDSDEVCEVFFSEIDDKAKQTGPSNLENQGVLSNNKTASSEEQDCFSSQNEKISWLNTNVVQQFMHVMEWNVKKQILPQTIIEQMGGFVRVRQLIASGVKSLNNYINTASKMNLLEEDDMDLLDKHLMVCICGLLSDDIQTVVKEIAIWKDRGNQMSVYDFYTVKKVVWEITTMIKLDPKLRFHIILHIENLRYMIFSHPFSTKMESLPHSLMNNYQLANYFRNPKNPAENANFFQALFPVMYSNKPYSGFYEAIAGKLKFQLNDRFFDHLLRFLMEQLKETDLKSMLDLQIRILKLRIKAGVCYNFLKVIHEDADQFFENLLPFLQIWVQKYTLSNTLMEAKAMDFSYLEVFIKQALNIQDLYAISDTEPALLHFVINESMLIFWIKGIIAFFEDKNIPKQHYKPLIQFITQYLLFRKEIEIPSVSSEKDII